MLPADRQGTLRRLLVLALHTFYLPPPSSLTPNRPKDRPPDPPIDPKSAKTPPGEPPDDAVVEIPDEIASLINTLGHFGVDIDALKGRTGELMSVNVEMSAMGVDVSEVYSPPGL